MRAAKRGAAHARCMNIHTLRETVLLWAEPITNKSENGELVQDISNVERNIVFTHFDYISFGLTVIFSLSL